MTIHEGEILNILVRGSKKRLYPILVWSTPFFSNTVFSSAPGFLKSFKTLTRFFKHDSLTASHSTQKKVYRL